MRILSIKNQPKTLPMPMRSPLRTTSWVSMSPSSRGNSGNIWNLLEPAWKKMIGASWKGFPMGWLHSTPRWPVRNSWWWLKVNSDMRKRSSFLMTWSITRNLESLWTWWPITVPVKSGWSWCMWPSRSWRPSWPVNTRITFGLKPLPYYNSVRLRPTFSPVSTCWASAASWPKKKEKTAESKNNTSASSKYSVEL